jgi:hypothetical protein
VLGNENRLASVASKAVCWCALRLGLLKLPSLRVYALDALQFTTPFSRVKGEFREIPLVGRFTTSSLSDAP